MVSGAEQTDNKTRHRHRRAAIPPAAMKKPKDGIGLVDLPSSGNVKYRFANLFELNNRPGGLELLLELLGVFF